ncbi:MAG: putative transport system ATP-binding protein [Acidimicrobiaceae bacterium]|jgi:putative ABC transport system ATP-binding protein
MIEAKGLYRFFHDGDEEVVALAGASLRIERGEMVAVMGPSGSGKSTLLACLGALDEPDGGTVVVDGQPISRRSEPERARFRAQHIGMLFQNRNLIPHLTVDENVRLARRLTGTRKGQPDPTLLQRLGIADRRSALPEQLSGGEAARAGLAVACANEPGVLLADEPTGEVDSSTELDVIALLRSVAARGAAVVVVTHSRSVARAAHRVLHLDDGRLMS